MYVLLRYIIHWNNLADILSKHWDLLFVWPNLQSLLFDWQSTEEHKTKDDDLVIDVRSSLDSRGAVKRSSGP